MQSLWQAIQAKGPEGRALHAPGRSVELARVFGSGSESKLRHLAGSTVVLAVVEQLDAALGLIALDGIAGRLVLCPGDVSDEHLAFVIDAAEADVVLVDAGRAPAARLPCEVLAIDELVPAMPAERDAQRRTEWVLLTSGTTGLPKLVVHTLASLTGPITAVGTAPAPQWTTFYDIRRYGGLQVFLRAMLGGGSLILSAPEEPVADFLGRAAAHRVTHILGTPTHWRRALMSAAVSAITPRYVRLSGEIADQTILDHLRDCYRGGAVVHAFASTEAGVAFEVTDGKAGFPATFVGTSRNGVELKVEDGSLHIRSPRTAMRYLGKQAARLVNDDGFVDTGDMVEQCADRFFFVGRRGGVINVGGQKIHPEEVEAVINSHPSVRVSLVRARKSPITGALVIADVVPRASADVQSRKVLEHEIIEHCRARLPRYKVPAAINFVASLDVAASGKLERRSA